VRRGELTAERFCAELGEEIRRGRQKAGLSQEELGERIGLHRNSVARYEGGADIPMMVFVRLCVALGMPTKDVLDRVLGEDSSARIRKANGLRGR
jgi:transcriptional regulator with XRE-family HTH domain